MDRARRSVQAAKLKELELHGTVETKTGHVAIMTMHMAKGLELRREDQHRPTLLKPTSRDRPNTICWMVSANLRKQCYTTSP